MGTARLVQRVSSALMSRSYRSDAGDWDAEDDWRGGGTRDADRSARRRPSPTSKCCSSRRRRPRAGPRTPSKSGSCGAPEDEFVYEPVFVGSFEDAALAMILNTNLESVVIYDGFSYASRATCRC